MSAEPVVIAGYARTPMGGFQGRLAAQGDRTGRRLGRRGGRARRRRAGGGREDLHGLRAAGRPRPGAGAPGGDKARASAIDVEATTVNKMCGSGMQAAIMAADTIAAGSADIVVAGGMESMTNAPYFLPKHRAGARIGHDRIIDHMFFDGLEDAYEQGRLMGSFAEDAARDYQFTREEQDDYAIASLTRAQEAQAQGWFDAGDRRGRDRRPQGRRHGRRHRRAARQGRRRRRSRR